MQKTEKDVVKTARLPAEPPSKPPEKPNNPDRIDDKWRPPVAVTEPGDTGLVYVVGKKLGKGGFAVCFEGTTQNTGELFALKVVKAKVEQKKMMEKFRTEMQIHAKMRHPNIVEFYRAFSRQDHTYVVLEMCNNGSLTDMVRTRKCLSLPEVRRFMIQICGGVKYMHKRNVIHRDLKMGNIFLDAQMNIKIGDFGLAAVLADEQDRRTTLCGTPNYIAPEILSKSGTRGHDSKVDVWAIGIICYAMLIGIPPFQSKTQQEIYSKLKTLDYEWKVDSHNYIPQDAKDLVAACLNLLATDRPEMDDLVEMNFFKTGVIADTLDSRCLQEKPQWLLNADPRGDRVMSGCGISHEMICSLSGVGRQPDGTCRPAAGEKGKISALVEIEAENRKGCAPVTPLPEGILYRQFTDPEPPRSAFQRSTAARPRSKKPGETASDVSTAISRAPPVIDRHVSAARPVQSFAATQRQQAAPSKSVGIERLKVDEPTRSMAHLESGGLLKAKPMRTATRPQRTMNSIPSPTAPSRTAVRSSDRLPIQTAAVEPSTVRGIPRPRSVAYDVTQPRPQSSHSDNSSDDNRRRAFKAVAGNIRPKAQTIVSLAEVEDDFAHKLRLNEPRPDVLSRASFKPRLIDDHEPYTRVHGTSYTHVMRSLRDLHSALGDSTSNVRNTRSPSTRARPYPRVDKWVDYATKHGIAYLLTDGTLGMLLKSRTDPTNPHSATKPSASIVLRRAKRHVELRSRNKTLQYVPQGEGVSPVEFYEQSDASEPMRRLEVAADKFALDMDGHESQSAAATALLQTCQGSENYRLKEVGLLDKFGKYMHKQMGTADGDVSSSRVSTRSQRHGDENNDNAPGHLITFYQRIGNVGTWRFADGGIQFNFPDHTKLVLYTAHERLSESEVHVDFTYLEPSDAIDMRDYGSVTHEALFRRAIASWRLSDILTSSTNTTISSTNLSRKETEIIRTNEVGEKLDWVRGVLGCWIRYGGVGYTGEERLAWTGLGAKAAAGEKKKMSWVTVGRPGGDEA